MAKPMLTLIVNALSIVMAAGARADDTKAETLGTATEIGIGYEGTLRPSTDARFWRDGIALRLRVSSRNGGDSSAFQEYGPTVGYSLHPTDEDEVAREAGLAVSTETQAVSMFDLGLFGRAWTGEWSSLRLGLEFRGGAGIASDGRIRYLIPSELEQGPKYEARGVDSQWGAGPTAAVMGLLRWSSLVAGAGIQVLVTEEGRTVAWSLAAAWSPRLKPDSRSDDAAEAREKNDVKKPACGAPDCRKPKQR